MSVSHVFHTFDVVLFPWRDSGDYDESNESFAVSVWPFVHVPDVVLFHGEILEMETKAKRAARCRFDRSATHLTLSFSMARFWGWKRNKRELRTAVGFTARRRTWHCPFPRKDSGDLWEREQRQLRAAIGFTARRRTWRSAASPCRRWPCPGGARRPAHGTLSCPRSEWRRKRRTRLRSGSRRRWSGTRNEMTTGRRRRGRRPRGGWGSWRWRRPCCEGRAARWPGPPCWVPGWCPCRWVSPPGGARTAPPPPTAPWFARTPRQGPPRGSLQLQITRFGGCVVVVVIVLQTRGFVGGGGGRRQTTGDMVDKFTVLEIYLEYRYHDRYHDRHHDRHHAQDSDRMQQKVLTYEGLQTCLDSTV